MRQTYLRKGVLRVWPFGHEGVELRVSQGFWGTREHWQNIEGNKGTLANFWEQGNKIRKITVRKHSERVWEHGNIGQFWKGTREQGPPGRPSELKVLVNFRLHGLTISQDLSLLFILHIMKHKYEGRLY